MRRALLIAAVFALVLVSAAQASFPGWTIATAAARVESGGIVGKTWRAKVDWAKCVQNALPLWANVTTYKATSFMCTIWVPNATSGGDVNKDDEVEVVILATGQWTYRWQCPAYYVCNGAP